VESALDDGVLFGMNTSAEFVPFSWFYSSFQA
jgi:hypothetical protein